MTKSVTDDHRVMAGNLWERKIGETARQFEFFRAYRDMGTSRTLKRVAKQFGVSDRRIEMVSQQNQWTIRIGAWEDEQDRIQREAFVRQTNRAAERHANVAMLFIQKTVERLQDLKPEEIKSADLPRYFETAVRVERTARGLPNEQIAHGGIDGQPIDVRQKIAIDLSLLSTEQLDMLESITLALQGTNDNKVDG